MKKIRLAVISLLFITACGEDATKQPTQVQAPSLPVISVENVALTSEETYPVTIEGIQNINISPKVDGYITKVLVDEGDWVKKGQPLFRQEAIALNQNAKAAKAAVEAAEIEVEKLKPLVEKRIVSQIQLETAEANLARAKGAYQTILANIGYTSINSPVEGIVGTIQVREGALVSPASMPLTTVSSIKEIFAFFSMNEKAFLNLIKETEGKDLKEKISHFPAAVLYMANKDKFPHSGKIETVSGNVDRTTGAMRLRARFENPELLLRNGSSGRIALPKYFDNQIAIPLESTYDLQGLKHVYVLTKENKLEARIVEIEKVIGKYGIIKAGLTTGEKIVAKGVGKCTTGMQITPQMTSTQKVIDSYQAVFK